MKEKVVADYKEQNISGVWILRYRLDGERKWHCHRLRHAHKPIKATAKTFDTEAPEIQQNVRFAILEFVQGRIDNPQPSQCPYKTWKQAAVAYLKWYAENRHGRGPEERMRIFIQTFGELPLCSVQEASIRLWVEDVVLPRAAAWDTLRLTIAAPQGLVSWLRKRKQWPGGDNPFDRLAMEYIGRYEFNMTDRSTITDEEYNRLLAAAHGDKRRAARIFVNVAMMTGLRPTEIFNLDVSRLDRNTRIWEIPVTKTRGRRYNRFIAVPDALIAFLANENVSSGSLPLSGLQKQFRAVRKDAGLETVQQKTFRKDFAHRMRSAGASKDDINLHQGRRRYDVLDAHYLTDQRAAAEHCRTFIDRMFSEGQKALRIV